ncbi:hypothetical protein ALC62_04338, partial [Cyphomyrmex costatus]
LVILVCSISGFIGTSLWTTFIDIVLSANVSRSLHLQISTEYFINQQKYFYLLFFHVNATVAIGCTVISATGTLLIAFLQHACGMFKIASYRIERAIHIYLSNNISMQEEILVYKGLIRAIDMHRKSMTFSNYFVSRFQISFMLLITVGVLSLSLNIFRVSFVFYELTLMIAHIISYKVRWYVTSLRVQRLILILLQRGSKSFGMIIGGLFISSLECFATVHKTYILYTTIY